MHHVSSAPPPRPSQARGWPKCETGYPDLAWSLEIEQEAIAALSTPPAEGVVPVSVAMNAIEHVAAANYNSRIAEAKSWVRAAMIAATEGA